MSISSYGSSGAKSRNKLKFKGNASSSSASAFSILSSIFSNEESEENDESPVAYDDESHEAGNSTTTYLLTYLLTHSLPFSADVKYTLPSVRINLNEEDDEDVRTERFRGKLIQEELNKLRQVH